MSETTDLSVYAKTMFYAGKPETATPELLRWHGHDYHMEVRSEGGSVVATMTSGNCEWRTEIDPGNFLNDVNDALEDACHLGHAINWTNDE